MKGVSDAFLVFLFVAVALPHVSFCAETIYLAPNGTDHSGCGDSQNDPCGTMNYVIQNFGLQNISFSLEPGTYQLGETLFRNVSSIAITSSGGDVVLECSHLSFHKQPTWISISNITFTCPSRTPFIRGGAIGGDVETGIIAIKYCNFINLQPHCEDEVGVDMLGGAISISGFSDIEIFGSEFVNCSCYCETINQFAAGGAIAIRNSTFINITFCLFKENNVVVPKSINMVRAEGGAVYVNFELQGEVIFQDCVFVKNFVSSDANTLSLNSGGAVSVSGAATYYYFTLRATNCRFQENTANATVGSFGGAVSVFAGHETNITNSTFYSNCAGGISINGGMDVSDIFGGAIYLVDTQLLLQFCTFFLNQAVGSIQKSFGTKAVGGAVAMDFGSKSSYQDVTIQGCKFTQNIAQGGDVEQCGLAGSSYGSAIYLAQKAQNLTLQIRISESFFELNNALSGICNSIGLGVNGYAIGAIHMQGGKNSTVSVKASLFSANFCGSYDSKGSISGISAGSTFNDFGEVKMQNVTFFAEKIVGDIASYSAALFMEGNIKVLLDSVHVHNSSCIILKKPDLPSTPYGCGIILRNNENFGMTNCLIRGNVRQDGYGAALTVYTSIYKYAGEITHSIFEENDAQYGGAIFQYNTEVSYYNCTFRNNAAAHAGGAMKVLYPRPPPPRDQRLTKIENCMFDGNIAIAGGAIECISCTHTKIINSVFSKNEAIKGGAFASDTYLFFHGNLVNISFVENVAKWGGFSFFINITEELIDQNYQYCENCTFQNGTQTYGTKDGLASEPLILHVNMSTYIVYYTNMTFSATLSVLDAFGTTVLDPLSPPYLCSYSASYDCSVALLSSLSIEIDMSTGKTTETFAINGTLLSVCTIYFVCNSQVGETENSPRFTLNSNSSQIFIGGCPPPLVIIKTFDHQLTCGTNYNNIFPVIVGIIVIPTIVTLILLGYWMVKFLREYIRRKRSDELLGSPVVNGLKELEIILREHSLLIDDNDIQLHGRLGMGSSGVVYSANWCNPRTKTNEIIAIKVITQFLFLSREVSPIFKEIQLGMTLEHPNIVQMKGVVLFGEGDLGIATELIEGGDLKNWLAMTGAELPPQYLLNIAKDVAGAIAYLHQRKIVHRDIKPANILVKDDGTAKLADFGIARILSISSNSATICGTPQYMAPEIISTGAYSFAVDVYSFGVTMAEMFTGNPPFKDSSENNWPHFLLTEVASGRLKVDVEGLSPELQTLILECCNMNPADRPSIEEVLLRLNRQKPENIRKLNSSLIVLDM